MKNKQEQEEVLGGRGTVGAGGSSLPIRELEVRGSIGAYIDSLVERVHAEGPVDTAPSGDVAFAERIVELERKLATVNAFLTVSVSADEASPFKYVAALTNEEHLRADGETAEEALRNLGRYCAFVYAEMVRLRDGAPRTEEPPEPVGSFRYVRKTDAAIQELARAVRDGEVLLAHGAEEMSRCFPVVITAIKADDVLNAEMARAGVVAMYERIAKQRQSEGGKLYFATAGTLDGSDYGRLARALNDVQ